MPKRFLARSTNSLPKAAPTSTLAQVLAVAHDRRHAEDAERLAARLDADDLPTGLERLDHGGAAGGNVVAESLGRVDADEGDRRRQLEGDQRDALRLQRLVGVAEQREETVAVALGDGIADRRQGRDHGGDCQRGASFIVDRGNHAFILQLELLIEREPRQRPLLGDREAGENGAGHRNGERDGENQAGGNRLEFEHRKFPGISKSCFCGRSQKLLNNKAGTSSVFQRIRCHPFA
ncbi:hypothetical protein ACVWWG_003516 [Bradyrhizobium sp. LB7.2]